MILAATVPDIATFAVGAALTLGGALGVISLRNSVHAALSLVVTLFGVAVLFVLQQAHFLAAVQVIVYAGAIVVLFLFVIMLLGVDRSESPTQDRLRFQRPLAVLFSLGIVGLVVGLGRLSWEATGAPSRGGAQSAPGSDIEKLADSIFTQYVFPFEATSLLLVIAVVGAVVMSRRPGAEFDGELVAADEEHDYRDEEVSK